MTPWGALRPEILSNDSNASYVAGVGRATALSQRL